MLIFAAAFMLLYNASTFAAQISNEFFYNQFYTETGIGSRVSLDFGKTQLQAYFRIKLTLIKFDMNSAVAFMLVGLSAVLSCLFVRSFGITVVLVTVPQSSFEIALWNFENCEKFW